MPEKNEADAKTDILGWDASQPFLYEQLYQLLDDFAGALQGKGQLVANLLPEISLDKLAIELKSIVEELKNIKLERTQNKSNRKGKLSRVKYLSTKPAFSKNVRSLQKKIFTHIFAIAQHPETENKRQVLIKAFIQERNNLLRNDDTPNKETDWDQVEIWGRETEKKLNELIERNKYLESWAITRKGLKGLEQLAWDIDSLAKAQGKERPGKVKQLLQRVFSGYKNSLQVYMGPGIVHESIKPDFVSVRLLRIFDRLTEYLITANLGYKQLHLLKNSLQIWIEQDDRFRVILKDGTEIEGNACTDDNVPRPGSKDARPVVIKFNPTFYCGDEQKDRIDRQLIDESQKSTLKYMANKFLPPALAYLLADPFSYVPIHEFGHFRNWFFDEKAHTRKDDEQLKAVGIHAAMWGSKEKRTDAYVLSQYDTGQQVDPYTEHAITPEHVQAVEKAVGRLQHKTAGQRHLQHITNEDYDPEVKQHSDRPDSIRLLLQPISKLPPIYP